MAVLYRFYCMIYLTLIMLNKLRCHAKLLIFSQSEYLIQVVHTNSNTSCQIVQIQISWLHQKPTELDLHCKSRVYLGSVGQGLRYIQNVTFSELSTKTSVSNRFLTHCRSHHQRMTCPRMMVKCHLKKQCLHTPVLRK